ncbi:hypothetical protein KCU91_g11, partial [Aureobasidium melanogenum]
MPFDRVVQVLFQQTSARVVHIPRTSRFRCISQFMTRILKPTTYGRAQLMLHYHFRYGVSGIPTWSPSAVSAEGQPALSTHSASTIVVRIQSPSETGGARAATDDAVINKVVTFDISISRVEIAASSRGPSCAHQQSEGQLVLDIVIKAPTRYSLVFRGLQVLSVLTGARLSSQTTMMVTSPPVSSIFRLPDASPNDINQRLTTEVFAHAESSTTEEASQAIWMRDSDSLTVEESSLLRLSSLLVPGDWQTGRAV